MRVEGREGLVRLGLGVGGLEGLEGLGWRQSRSVSSSTNFGSTVERIWRIYDSQGQILAVAFWEKS